MVGVRIPLSQGQVAHVSIQDAERVLLHKWSAHKRKYTYYAFRAEGKRSGRTIVLLHRFIMGATSGEKIDHIDRNGLNCVRSNMRKATMTQNAANHRKPSNNTSGFRGVSFMSGVGKRQRVKRWRATIRVEGKQKTIGYFLTAEDAARAWDKEAIRAWGAFALTNYPKGDYRDD